MTNSPLHQLHLALASLGRQRQWIRWGTAGVTMWLAVLITLAAIFAVDVLFEMDVLQRLMVFTMAIAALGWTFYRLAWPHLKVRETTADLALIVERENGIESDLVAAIEFELPTAASWGSPALRQAVIDRAASRSGTLRIGQATERRDLNRRGKWLATALLIWGLGAICCPEYIAVFLRRMVLAPLHYPTRTVIAGVEVNGQLVLASARDASPRATQAAERHAVQFRVLCSRRPPARGEVRVWDLQSGQQQSLVLEPGHRELDSVGTGVPAWFVARLPVLTGAVRYEVHLGDAWTNAAMIRMLPLPLVELRFLVQPPDYVGSQVSADIPEGASRLAVLEGSAVQLGLRCVNGKRLRSVWMRVRTAAGESRYALSCNDPDGLDWTLPKGVAGALDDVREQIAFDCEVVDVDGLTPDHVPEGLVRVRADAPPDAVATTVHSVVLPAAAPRVEYWLNDDFGIGRLRMEVQIERQGEVARDAAAQDVDAEVHWVNADDLTVPLRRDQLPVSGRLTIDLEPWKLEKGDQLRLTPHVTDYRGPRAGETVRGKPLYLTVSDEAGVLEAILEADRRTEKGLDEMIRRQMGWEDGD